MCKKVTALIMLMLTCVLAGCGQEKTAQISSVSVTKDGTVKQQIVGSFEQSYYELEGLRRLADDRVSAYTAEHGEKSVMLDSLEEKDGQIVIDFTYLSVKDYTAFNHRELYAGSVAQAKAEGYVLDNIAFISTKNEPYEPGAIEGLDDMSIVIIATRPGEELNVNVYGKVLYINQSAMSNVDVDFNGKKSAHIVNLETGQEETAEEASLSYMIFQ